MSNTNKETDTAAELATIVHMNEKEITTSLKFYATDSI
jgi:hypothetical protein